MANLDFINRANADYVDGPVPAVPARSALGRRRTGRCSSPASRPARRQRRRGAPRRAAQPTAERSIGVFDLIHSYRELGHLVADLNPLGHKPAEPSAARARRVRLRRGRPRPRRRVPDASGAAHAATLRELIGLLRATYCGTLGVEYMHIPDQEQRDWLQERMEPTLNQPELSAEDRMRILDKLAAAEGFEQFLHAKYVGQKRFSLEGGESLIPMLDTLIEEAGAVGVEEIVIGMPHRGRLNVLANVLRKPLRDDPRRVRGHASCPPTSRATAT